MVGHGSPGEVVAPASIVLRIGPYPVGTLARRVELALLRGLNASRPGVDGGVDGITAEGVGLQITLSRSVARPKLDLFAAGMRRHGLREGWLIAPSFGQGVVAEAERLAAHGLVIQLVSLQLLWTGLPTNGLEAEGHHEGDTHGSRHTAPHR
jgi:hypothetical protein